MSKFKVGDTVIATEEANKRYGITRCGWIGVVYKAELGRENDFAAKSVKNRECFELDDRYFCLWVDPNKVSDEEFFSTVFS